MTTTKRWALALAAATVLTGAPRAADAFCGFYVAGADGKLFNNATMVVMMRDGTRTVLAMQNNYQGPPESFAMVVPVPVVLQKENVKTLPREVFDRVDQMAAPRLVEYWEQDPCATDNFRGMPMMAPMAKAEDRAAGTSAGALGVRIEAQFEVGEYDVVILSASDSMGLDTWLRQEKYKIPDGAEPLLRPYVQAGSKFFVAKVDAAKVKFDKGMATLSPLRFHYDTDAFSLPVRLGLINSAGTQDLIVHVFAKQQRYEVANYPNVTIPTNFDVEEAARDRFGAFYAALFDATLEKNPRAVVTEYAWAAQSCDPCPGPTLGPSDLMTLGADVLPSVQRAAPIASVRVELPPAVAREGGFDLQWKLQQPLTSCYERALAEDRSLKGDVVIELGDKGARVAPSGGFPSGAFAACIAAALDKVPMPRVRNEPLLASIPVHFVTFPNPGTTSDFVLTRLHARYGADALGEDLVFRAAPPIVGGRETVGADGRLEHGATQGSWNNFQARYAIRHPWRGPIACAAPRRGVWGGPPPGERGGGTKAARDLAFAPRGEIKLASFVRQEIPELEIKPGVGGGACGCRVADADGRPEDAAPWALGAATCLGAIAARRRRRRSPGG